MQGEDLLPPRVSSMARLSTPLQIQHLKTRFTKLNPEIGVDVIDWGYVIDEKLAMSENVDVFIDEYPQYKWELPEPEVGQLYMKQIVDAARDQVTEFSYDVVKSRRLGVLEKAAARATKLRISLEKCQGLRPKRPPRKKITCKESEKIEVCFMRCPRPG